MKREAEVTVFIERDERGHLFQVVTARRDFSGYTDWQFEWCRRDRCAYYDMAGFGGLAAPEWTLHCRVPATPPHRIWAAPGLRLMLGTRSGEEVPATPGRLRRAGYVPMRRPRVDPFDERVAMPSETIYCKTCDDHLPIERLCAHAGTCYECSEHYSEPREYLHHRWHDREPARAELRRFNRNGVLVTGPWQRSREFAPALAPEKGGGR